MTKCRPDPKEFHARLRDACREIWGQNPEIPLKEMGDLLGVHWGRVQRAWAPFGGYGANRQKVAAAANGVTEPVAAPPRPKRKKTSDPGYYAQATGVPLGFRRKHLGFSDDELVAAIDRAIDEEFDSVADYLRILALEDIDRAKKEKASSDG